MGVPRLLRPAPMWWWGWEHSPSAGYRFTPKSSASSRLQPSLPARLYMACSARSSSPAQLQPNLGLAGAGPGLEPSLNLF